MMDLIFGGLPLRLGWATGWDSLSNTVLMVNSYGASHLLGQQAMTHLN